MSFKLSVQELVQHIPTGVLTASAPRPYIFKTPLFAAYMANKKVLAYPGGPDINLNFSAQKTFAASALLGNPRLHDLDTLEGVSKHFPAYDNPVSPAQHLWLQAYGEGVSELTAFRKLSLWDYVYRYETEFAYAYPRFMTKAKLLEAFAKRGVPCLQGNLVPIFKIGRAMACYPKRTEAEWVATWWLLQKYSARYTLRNELVTHPQKPWRQCILDALQMFQVLGVSPDLRCVIYWIFYMRTHGLLVRQAERAGLLK